MTLQLTPSVYQKLLRYSSIWIGLSGGLDSVALLQLLSSQPALKSRLRVIHVHHGISAHADDWALFCAALCQTKDIPFVLEKVTLSSSQNLEASARARRYEAFEKHLAQGHALCLAHHQDDHLETFFLQALRGTGLKGLAGIDAHRLHGHFAILRPLLDFPRAVILAYAQAHHLSWVEDDSNADSTIFRNYLRHEILPRIEKKWPHYRRSLQHTMNACRDLVDQLGTTQVFNRYLNMLDYADMNAFEWQQLLRAWIKANTQYYPSQKILQQILQQMIYAKRADNEAIIHLGEYRLIAYRRVLEIFIHTPQPQDTLWDNFPHPLWIEAYGEIALSAELLQTLQVLASDTVYIRFRCGGEKIKQRHHHASLKKQFQERGIPPYQRKRIALLYVNDLLRHVFFPAN